MQSSVYALCINSFPTANTFYLSKCFRWQISDLLFMGGSGFIASGKLVYQNVLVCMIIFPGLPKRLSYQWHSVLGVYWIPWPIWLAVPRIYGFIISHIPLVLYWLFLKERQKKVILNYCFLINDLKYILLNLLLSFQKGLLNSNY